MTKSSSTSQRPWEGLKVELQREQAVLREPSEVCSMTLWVGPWLQVTGWPLRLFGQGRIFRRPALVVRVPKCLDLVPATFTSAVVAREVCISGSFVSSPAQSQFQEPMTGCTSAISCTCLQICTCLGGCHVHKSCLPMSAMYLGLSFSRKKVQGRSSKNVWVNKDVFVLLQYVWALAGFAFVMSLYLKSSFCSPIFEFHLILTEALIFWHST